jgi:hypothetical protein
LPIKGDKKMTKLINGYGFKMTTKQLYKLSDLLTENILERYNTPEYIDYNIIEHFAIENKLKRIEK